VAGAERVLWSRDAAIPAADTAPLPPTADVVVVGAGYCGASAARELARGGLQTVLLEQGGLGAGASARNGGFVHAGVRRTVAELRRRYGEELGSALYDDTVAAFAHVEEIVRSEQIDCDYERCGYLLLADRPRRARALRAAHDSLESTLLTREELPAHCGSAHHIAGLLLDGAASLHPARFLAGLIHSAKAAGASVHDRTAVAHLRQVDDGVDVVTNAGVVRARHVFVATDGYTAGLHPYLRRRVIPIDSFILATEPIPAALRSQVSPRGHLCVERKNFLTYWRLLRDGRLMFGGRASFAPTSVPRASAWLRRQIARIYPQLEGIAIGIDFAWGGKTGFSLDQLPHVGREGDITYAVTYCGSGVALAPWLGTSAARWIAGGAPPPFARIPFPAVPLYRGRPWFLPLAGPLFALADRL
jgi:glycine/D-amino acid oxidase-like deaminating enzyme